MKICWDNLEDLRLVKSGKYFQRISKKTKYYYIDSCEVCGEPYLSSNSNSRSCSIKCRGILSSENLKGKVTSEGTKQKISKANKGKESSFKGRQHSEQSIQKMIISRTGQFAGENNPRYGDHRTWDELHGEEKSNELKNNMSERWSGENNPNCGGNHWLYRKTESEIESWKEKVKEKNWWTPWVKDKTFEEIYGIDKAQKIKSKISNSVMKSYDSKLNYIPTNYSFGYTGYYKDIFFRSLNELSYILHLINNNIRFEDAECKKFRINYKDSQEKWRYYFPDFYLVDTEELIEIKSTYTWNSKLELNKCKKYYTELLYPKYRVLTEVEFEKENIPLLDKSDLIYKYINDDNLDLTQSSKNRLSII